MSDDDIKKCLHTRVFGRRLLLVDSLDSTNERAKALIRQGEEEGTAVVAEEQTAGRGRLGRSWHSERGKNLTFSLIVTPDMAPAEAGLLSLCAALAVSRALGETAGLSAECKWPNDVLLNGKKCCGILSEAIPRPGRNPAIVIGIGINVNQSAFPPEIERTATSVMLAAGREVDRAALLAAVLLHLESLYALLLGADRAAIVSQWTEACPMTGTTVAVDAGGTRLSGTVAGFDRDGAMILRTEGSERKIYAGDVTIIQP